MIKALKGSALTETAFYTILTDVDASVNSRPLAKLLESEDDENITFITPNHLILGWPLNIFHKIYTNI